jgi:hypothetical protein
MAEKQRARGIGIKLAAASVAMVVADSGAALAATIPGTNAGEVPARHGPGGHHPRLRRGRPHLRLRGRRHRVGWQ